MIRLLVCGVNGAMGKAVVDCAIQTENIQTVAGFDMEDLGDYPFPVLSDFDELAKIEIDGVIDFSHYSAAKPIAEFCIKEGIPLVSATTGIDEETEQIYQKAADTIQVFRSKNFSYGISVIKKLLAEATRLLAADFDIEMIEMHHNKKLDAPSGTAQMLLDSIQDNTDQKYDLLYGRYGKDAKRKSSDITVHAVRGGTIVGEHEVIFAGNDEVIKISHSAQSKRVFAAGAIKALQFIVTQPSGFYTMDDITNQK